MDNEIYKLDLFSLSQSDVVYNYYDRHCKFSTVSGYGFNKIPILESASNFISHEHLQFTDGIKLKYPFKSYIEGFIDEYSKPIGGDLNTDEGKIWLLRHIQPTTEPNLNQTDIPDISIRYVNGIQEKYFSEEKAKDYGVYNARAYKVWEFVINNLPFYEKVFAVKQDVDLKGLSQAILKKTHKEFNGILWNGIKQDEFLSILDRNKQPTTKLQPIQKNTLRYLFNKLCKVENLKNYVEYLDKRTDTQKGDASDVNEETYSNKIKKQIDNFIESIKK